MQIVILVFVSNRTACQTTDLTEMGIKGKVLKFTKIKSYYSDDGILEKDKNKEIYGFNKFGSITYKAYFNNDILESSTEIKNDSNRIVESYYQNKDGFTMKEIYSFNKETNKMKVTETSTTNGNSTLRTYEYWEVYDGKKKLKRV